MNNHTDTQLKQVLAKMLPEEIFQARETCYPATELRFRHRVLPVLDTELLHLCWVVEETLDAKQRQDYLNLCWVVEDALITAQANAHDHSDKDYGIWTCYVVALADSHSGSYGGAIHATWQQRTIALAKVKGVEIV